MQWLNEPATWQRTDDVLTVSADAGTDFWRETGYGYVHDNGHVYGEMIEGDLDLQVKVRATLTATYDQAGLILRVDDEVWLKTGLELFDGRPRLSTVLTLGKSSWMVTDLPEGTDELTLRASRRGDAVEVRYIIGDGSAELAALAYLPPERPVLAGVMCAAPEGEGFRATFHSLRLVDLEAPGGENPLWPEAPEAGEPSTWAAGTETGWERPEVSDDAATPHSAWPALTEAADEPVSRWPDPAPARSEPPWPVAEPVSGEPPWSIPEPASGPTAYEAWASPEVAAEQEPTREPVAEAAAEEPGRDGDASERPRDAETGRTPWFGAAFGAAPQDEAWHEEGARVLVPADGAQDKAVAVDAALPGSTATGGDAPEDDLPEEVALPEVAPREVAPREVAPPEVAPPEVAPREEAPREVAPREEALREVAPREVALREEALREVVPREEAHGPEVTDEVAADEVAVDSGPPQAGTGPGEKAGREPTEPGSAEPTPWSAWEPVTSGTPGSASLAADKAIDDASPRTASWDPARPDTADSSPRDGYLTTADSLGGDSLGGDSLGRDSWDEESEDGDSARPAVAESLPPPPPAAWVARDLTDRWPGPPLVSLPDDSAGDVAVGPHDPVPAVTKRTKPKPAPVLDDPPDPADEWISLLTTDPADE